MSHNIIAIRRDRPANLDGFRTTAGATAPQLRAIEAALGRTLPADYVSLMESSNGCSGFVDDRYLWIWAAEEIIENNKGYGTFQYAPNLTLIGTNGSGTGYAIRWTAERHDYVAIPFIDIGTEPPEHVGDDIACLFTEAAPILR